MIEIEMSKDIKEQEVKILGPFTGRQVVCLGIAAAYGIPLIFILPGEMLFRIVVAIVIMMPTVMCGWCRVYGLPLEKFLWKAATSFMQSKERIYVSENCFDELLEIPPQIGNVSRKVDGEVLL